MQLEGKGAARYFDSWLGFPLPWKKDRMISKLPPHWISYPGRLKPKTERAKDATDPLNSLLNFCYGCLAARLEAIAISYGIDCSCTILHSDKENRASLTWDLIEPIRPVIDSNVLSFIKTRKLVPGDFVQQNNGVVKLSSEFSRLVSTAVDIPASIVGAGIQRYIKELK